MQRSGGLWYSKVQAFQIIDGGDSQSLKAYQKQTSVQHNEINSYRSIAYHFYF